MVRLCAPVEARPAKRPPPFAKPWKGNAEALDEVFSGRREPYRPIIPDQVARRAEKAIKPHATGPRQMVVTHAGRPQGAFRGRHDMARMTRAHGDAQQHFERFADIFVL